MDVTKRNNVRISGVPDGRAMVFAHGFGCDQNMWRFVAPAFEDGFRIVLFDHVGAGGSDLSAYDPETDTPSLDGYADDVVELCAANWACSDAVFVGHSVSAMIGVLAARKAPGALRRPGAGRPLAALHRRRRTMSAASAEAQIEELLEFLDSNHMGWSQAMAPVIMGNRRPAGAWARN